MGTPEETSATTEQPSSTDSLENKLSVAEQRQKDTQASYTKGQQRIKALEAENAKYREQLESSYKVTISDEVQEELESLKYEDPDAWRVKINSLERDAKMKQKETLDSLTSEARQAAESQFEVDRRQQVLEQFNDSNGFEVTDELLANEVPPRIMKKLEAGEVTFEDFLNEVKDYVTTGKAVANPQTLNQPSLGKSGGTAIPTEAKPEISLASSYEKDLY